MEMAPRTVRSSVGELLSRYVGGGIDAGSGFGDGDGEDGRRLGRLRSRRKSRTNASVSREAVPLPMAMARTLCFAIEAIRGYARVAVSAAWSWPVWR